MIDEHHQILSRLTALEDARADQERRLAELEAFRRDTHETFAVLASDIRKEIDRAESRTAEALREFTRRLDAAAELAQYHERRLYDLESGRLKDPAARNMARAGLGLGKPGPE